MKSKLLAVFLISSVAAFAEATKPAANPPAPSVNPTAANAKGETNANIQFRNVNLESIFKATHGTDPRLGFDLSEEEKQQFTKEDSGPVYGEMTPEGTKRFLTYTLTKFNLDPSKIRLLDIGSGTGRVPIGCCALADFAQCHGVELSKARFDMSQKALAACTKEYSKIFKPNQIAFTHKNALDYDTSPYNLIWVSSLLFPETFMVKLLVKLEKELKPGTVILSSQAFVLSANSRLELIEVITMPMSWKKEGSVTRVYKVKGGANDAESKPQAATAA